MKNKTTAWDTAEFLDNEAEIEEYLKVSMETGDPKLIIKAFGNASRAYGMLKLARETGLNRESLYRSLSGEREPKFTTIFKVADSLGYRLSLTPKVNRHQVKL
jgi:probable addiction module antidote protein